MRVALLQINPTVGDLEGNARLIAEAARAAWQQGARVALAPELGLCGYPPEDLLLRPAFLRANAAALESLALALADCAGLHLVVGHPWDGGAGRQALGDHTDDLRSKSVSVPRVFNAASVLAGGRVSATYCKRELPNYQVFDERRYFVSGRDAGLEAVVFEAGGRRFGVLICEDAWFDEPAQLAKAAGADVLCVINASPFHLGKPADREARMAHRAQANALPLLYAHMTGGQDEVVFDGGSFALGASWARWSARAALFETATLSGGRRLPAGRAGAGRRERRRAAARARGPGLEAAAHWSPACATSSARTAFRAWLIGLSGGIDSGKLVLALAVDALGPERVRTVMMQSPYTADISWIDAPRERRLNASACATTRSRSRPCSTRSGATRWPASSPAWPRTPPKRTSAEPACAARC